MAEPEKQQFGDGRDNYAGAARQLSDALQQAGQTGTRQAVSNGVAALVQSGIKSGKAVSEIAAGTAAGGPWGQSFQQRGRYGTPCLRYSHVFVCFFSYL